MIIEGNKQKKAELSLLMSDPAWELNTIFSFTYFNNGFVDA